jgi:hypothetical protein
VTLEKNPCIPPKGHQKVLLSNLGLTAFVKHLIKLVKLILQSTLRRGKKRVKGTETSKVNWLSRFSSLPSGKKKKIKDIETSQSSFFVLYGSKSLQTLPLFCHKKYKCLTGDIGGQKSTSLGISVHASLSVTLIVIF